MHLRSLFRAVTAWTLSTEVGDASYQNLETLILKGLIASAADKGCFLSKS